MASAGRKVSDTRIVLIFLGIGLFAFIATGFGLYYLHSFLINKPQTSTSPNQKSVLDKTNVENVDLTIGSLGVEPSNVTLKATKDYDFRIIKNPGTICS